MPVEPTKRPTHFDVPYGLASASLTAGKTIVATTGADYHGASIIAGTTARAEVIIYDSISASSGNIVDTFLVATNSDVWIDRFIPVKGKLGLVVSVTGVDARGAIFYNPKG